MASNNAIFLTPEHADFWLDNNLNVILEGPAGCGKTSFILATFKRRGLKYLYFSAATMDPWTDLVGVPKEAKDPATGKAHLEFLRPRQIEDNDVEIIYLDEYNRAAPKVINATMELVQFKAINGRKFPNLRMVWAAINPEDDENGASYSVNTLDPAHLDRFQVHIKVPYQPSEDFFREKYGKEVGQIACSWWKKLPKEHKKLISPRRLDYMIDVHAKGGLMDYVADQNVNVDNLRAELLNGSVLGQLQQLVKKATDKRLKPQDRTDATNALRNFLSDDTKLAAVEDTVTESPKLLEACLPLFPEEKAVVVINKSKKVEDHVFANKDLYKDLLNALTKINSPLGAKAKKLLGIVDTTVNPEQAADREKIRVAKEAVMEHIAKIQKGTATP